MHAFRLTKHSLDITDNDHLNWHNIHFDVEAYSRFKYGCHNSTMLFAADILTTLNRLPDAWKKEEVLITGSAYFFAPTASNTLVDAIMDQNRPSFSNLKRTTLRRERTFPGDYGLLSFTERHQLMSGDRLTTDLELLRGKRLIVVDDIRVTGAHEKRVLELVSGIVNEVCFVYILTVESEYCNPSIEAIINHGYVKSIADLASIVDSGPMNLNARVCKYLLSCDDQEGLMRFLLAIPFHLLEELKRCVVGDGYHLMPCYYANYQTICAAVDERESSLATAI